MVDKVLPAELKGATEEIATYFGDGFGNRTRIDYGTGHETAFVTFLGTIAMRIHFHMKDVAYQYIQVVFIS